MLMHFNKRSRTFRYWSFFMVRSAACASFHLPKSLQLPSQVLRVDVYFEPPVEFSSAQVRSMLQDGSVDVLRGFSQNCRAEFGMLRAEQL